MRHAVLLFLAVAWLLWQQALPMTCTDETAMVCGSQAMRLHDPWHFVEAFDTKEACYAGLIGRRTHETHEVTYVMGAYHKLFVNYACLAERLHPKVAADE